jgi:tetratricopeptide (TPR) repeat protein
VATSLNNLAIIYKAQGQYAQAEPFFRRVLAIREKSLGPNHPDVATALRNLAQLYRATKRIAEAEQLEERAARIESNNK